MSRSLAQELKRTLIVLTVTAGEPPPPPVAFMNRHMPPPSPQQPPPAGPAYQGSRGPPPPPTFTSGRELPGLGSRGPGAGMSISSILGDGPALSQHGQLLQGTQSQSPPITSQQPPSPHRRGQSMSSKLGEYSWRRPQTPDRHHLPAGLRPEQASYSANSSPAHFANVRRSPEFTRAGPPLFPPSYPSGGPPRLFQGSPQERELQRRLEERIPPRPNSQPLAGPYQDEGPPRGFVPPFGARGPFSHFMPQERREEQRPPTTSAYEPMAGFRDRPTTVEPRGQPYSPRRDPRDTLLPREGPQEDPRRDSGLRDALKDDGASFRTGFRQFYQQRSAVPPPEAPRSHPQMGNPFDKPREGQPLAPHDRAIPSIDPLARDDRRISDPHAHISEGQYRSISGDHQPLMMQRSRSSIGLDGKRSRASPMPQAVQGAQMQPTGAGSDPNIKSEFGRIFQGLGSGLGGSMTPSRGSPMPQRHPSNAEGEPILLSDGEGVPQSGSLSKRNKRVKAEDDRYDDDGRGTPLARGGKRVKPGHHHHLHQHNHAHHHHIHGHLHRPEDLAGPNSAVHHHHHIHTSHHHHHSPLAPRAQASTPVPPMPKPTLTIESQPVLDSVARLPRKHLGSELYEPAITLPPSAMASHTYDPFGYFLKYDPKRTFGENDLNCTITIRVPKYYLGQESRENIVKNKNVIGTGIYTDDSDPIAVAVHEGWVRGEWPDDVDADVLDISAPSSDAVVQDEYTSVPVAPVHPPPDKDLHLTMLILPALKSYTGTVRHGIRSRDWDNTDSAHDGLSWTVLKMRWVDEAGSSGVKRSAAARRERLENQRTDAAMALVGLAGASNGVQREGSGRAVAVA